MDKRQTYESARAWSGPELAARRDWIYTLSKTQINELVAAAESTSDRDIVSLEHDDFDLPTLEPRTEFRATAVTRRGFQLRDAIRTA